jgi:hypothetical protein
VVGQDIIHFAIVIVDKYYFMDAGNNGLSAEGSRNISKGMFKGLKKIALSISYLNKTIIK